jgi:hypothetical protein
MNLLNFSRFCTLLIVIVDVGGACIPKGYLRGKRCCPRLK